MAAEIPVSINTLAGTTKMGIVKAANVWAGTSGFDFLGALNMKAGNTLPNWRDLDGVCQQLNSNKTGFSAQSSLSQLAGLGA